MVIDQPAVANCAVQNLELRPISNPRSGFRHAGPPM
jgi:hypothetical protein